MVTREPQTEVVLGCRPCIVLRNLKLMLSKGMSILGSREPHVEVLQETLIWGFMIVLQGKVADALRGVWRIDPRV